MSKPHLRKKPNGIWICTYHVPGVLRWTGRGLTPLTAYLACLRLRPSMLPSIPATTARTPRPS